MSQIYIIISIAALAFTAVGMILAVRNREASKLSPLAGLAFGFILAGLLFGQDRLLGYSLLGAGVVLAVIDIFRRARV